MAHARFQLVRYLAGFLGIVILGGGVLKVVGQTSQVAAFSDLGLPAWFRLLVGTFEIAGGVLMITPSTTPAGSLVLSTILVGAVWAHIANRQWLELIPAAALLPLLLLVFYVTRGRAIELLGGRA